MMQMASRRAAPGVVRHGTARQLADVGIGYTASGAGEYTRQAAHAAAGIKMNSHAPRKDRGRDFPGKRYPTMSLGEKIAFQASALAKLNIDLILETSAEKRAKIAKNVDIKTRFLERLKLGRA
jgi:hypothetical protein